MMALSMASQPRYPQILVDIESSNPLALVAAVREAMRLARVQRSEISRFSDEALATQSSREVEAICKRWVQIGDSEPN